MSYVIVIPSYQRASLLNDKTLLTLHRHGIPKELIHVFVVQEELEQYTKTLNPSFYHQLIVGVLGITQQRQFMEDYFPEGQYIVSMDDDIDDIDLSLTSFTTLDQFVTQAFQVCIQQSAYLWGVYPVYNPFFRRRDIECGLQFIVGVFYGVINRRGITPSLESKCKEDVERSILYYLKDGNVVRFGRVGVKTKYYGKEGGLGNFKSRLEVGRLASVYLQEKYPTLGKMWTRKNGMTEFRLHNKLKQKFNGSK